VGDLTKIRSYIARDSDTYAAAFVERIIVAIERLADFPRMGRRVPEIDDESIRELIVDRYRVIYRVRTEAIDIAAVVHGARDLLRAIDERSR
jgi:addiction module RelE/StbE family toxin